jgi:hypothetical protein
VIAYLNFVNSQGMTYEQLQPCLAVLGLKSHLSGLVESKKARLSIAALQFIRGSMGDRARLAFSSAIDTESNLKAQVFENIALTIGTIDLCIKNAMF